MRDIVTKLSEAESIPELIKELWARDPEGRTDRLRLDDMNE